MKKIFFNYATVGIMGKPAYTAASKFLKEYYRIGPPEVIVKYEAYVEELAKEIGALLNCSPDEITYTKNTTEGLNIASEILPLEKGDEVLIGGNEYPANHLVWQRKAKEGIAVRLVSGKDNDAVFRSLMEAISPRTRAIVIAWGEHYDGYLPDLELLSRVCHERNIFLVVDAVHGVGTRELDLTRTPVDILACGGQKYLGGIVGIGFVYVASGIMRKLKETRVGVRSMQHFDERSYLLKNTARRFEDGTINLLGVVALHAAIRHVNELGIKNIEKKNLKLLKKFKSLLKAKNVPFIDHERQSNVIALRVPDPAGLCEFLKGQGIYLKPVKDIARVSFSHNSKFRDFSRLVDKVKEWQLKAVLDKNAVAGAPRAADSVEVRRSNLRSL